jgi:hypothetical protein
MDSSTHLTVDDLVLYLDHETEQTEASVAEQHLLVCVECGERLRALQKGSAAYANYRDQVLIPSLGVPITGWAPIGGSLVAGPSKKRKRAGTGLWWMAAAAIAGMLATAWLYYGPSAEPSAQELLTMASAIQEPKRGSLLFTSSKYQFARPAVLKAAYSEAGLQHVQGLFVKANYSWQDPLSAKSFVAWRREQPERHDFVTSIHEQDGHRYYRVRTRTDTGILQSASLTLIAGTYHPIRASFEFKGEDPLEVSEQSEVPGRSFEEAHSVPTTHSKPAETAATPEDELRVLAALDTIGADVEDPIDITLDAGHHSVLVTGMGIAGTRQRQIEAALDSVPKAVLRFSDGQRLRGEPDAAPQPDASAKDANLLFRDKLEALVGGPRQLQAITDSALESSNALFAQSHSLLVLAREFPSPVEAALSGGGAKTLVSLRQRRVGAMEYGLRRLKENLTPRLTEGEPAGRSMQSSKLVSWQSGSEKLFEATRNLDRLLSRLLAGSYSDNVGDRMLKQLPGDLSNTEELLRAQSRAQ